MTSTPVSPAQKRTDNPPENRTKYFTASNTPTVDHSDWDYDRLMYDPDGIRGISGRPVMVANRKTLINERIPPKYRDYCSHLLIDLNQCRSENWRKFAFINRHYCDDTQLEWHRCEYQEYLSMLERRWFQLQDDKDRGIRKTFRGMNL